MKKNNSDSSYDSSDLANSIDSVDEFIKKHNSNSKNIIKLHRCEIENEKKDTQQSQKQTIGTKFLDNEKGKGK